MASQANHSGESGVSKSSPRLRTNDDVGAMRSIFDQGDHPRTCSQFGWVERSPLCGGALRLTSSHRCGKILLGGRRIQPLWHEGF